MLSKKHRMNKKFLKMRLFEYFFQKCEPLFRSFQEEKEGNSLSNPDLFPSATITASAEFLYSFHFNASLCIPPGKTALKFDGL